MKDSEKIKDNIIDEFYNESHNTLDENIKNRVEYAEFKNKLNSSQKKLEILNDDIFDFNIDTLNIIEQAAEIKESKKSKKEIGLFVLISFIILSLYASVGIIFGSKIVIISQLIIMSLMPWSIIPISIMKRKGSET